ncbi:MAG: sarcosine oxidase subunit alpha family protein [Hyphomicrobiaceae bacterium]
MAQTHRLAKGGRIDRGRPVALRFNGQAVDAFVGDTAASALLANGIHFVGRSFKYHRPRGIFSHGAEEANALFTVDRGDGRAEPNNRASAIEAVDGFHIRSQHHWPSLGFDLGAVNNALSPLFPAGFYYKTFMWPPAFWRRLYEPAIRAAAGLGRAPRIADPDRYAHRYAHCDVLVVGAGPAGLAAALAASEGGKRVILADEQAEMGGALLHDVTSAIDDRPAWDWLADALAKLAARATVSLLPRTTAFGLYNHNHAGLVERLTDHLGEPPSGLPRERLWQVRARSIVLATGAHERPLLFPGNDRPGIMLAESLRAFANRYAVLPGRRVVIVTTGASAYTVALDLVAAGAAVSVVDLRRQEECATEVAVLRDTGCEVLAGHAVIGSLGCKRVRGLVVAPFDGTGVRGARRTLPCDCVGLSGGWTPAVHLHAQLNKLAFDAGIDAFVPGPGGPGLSSVGAACGSYQLAACLTEGWQAGAAAAQVPERSFAASASRTGFRPVRTVPTTGRRRQAKAFVDWQNDVTQRDIALAVREGFTAIEHVKRYTTTGMATDQGKTSNMNALGLVADIVGKPVPEVGTTTYRPPYTPVTFGALAGPSRGDLLDPVRTPPTHSWALAHGAMFEDVGQWKRALCFPRAGEDMAAAVDRECLAVRSGVGMLDASTLGKIEVVGPDAAEFLDRIYTGSMSRLASGRCRYGLMLREDGYIFDDGVVARLGFGRFHLTTTTGGAARVLQHMEDYLQTEWPQLRVHLTSTTEQYAVIALQGPRSRNLLASLVEGIDLSNEAFPHMSVRSGTICGVRGRLFCVSFTGEAGYEINVPADFGLPLWERLMERGRALGITPYGTEAMHVLRAEKGFIIVGQETDGTVTPHDVGLGGLVASSKADFVGCRSLKRADVVAAGRKQLVGLLTELPEEVIEEGAQIVADPEEPIPMRALGHVTSSYWSAACRHSIALALIADGRSMIDGWLHVTTRQGFTKVLVTEPVFHDRAGGRVHA